MSRLRCNEYASIPSLTPTRRFVDAEFPPEDRSLGKEWVAHAYIPLVCVMPQGLTHSTLPTPCRLSSVHCTSCAPCVEQVKTLAGAPGAASAGPSAARGSISACRGMSGALSDDGNSNQCVPVRPGGRATTPCTFPRGTADSVCSVCVCVAQVRPGGRAASRAAHHPHIGRAAPAGRAVLLLASGARGGFGVGPLGPGGVTASSLRSRVGRSRSRVASLRSVDDEIISRSVAGHRVGGGAAHSALPTPTRAPSLGAHC